MKTLVKFTTILLFFVMSCSETSESMDLIEDANNPNSSVESEILDLINDYRVRKSLLKLDILDEIKTQTDLHTDYMIQKSKISHDDFSSRADYLKKNASAKGIAENVAAGYTTPKAVVDGWIKSDGHRKNIEGNFTHFHVTAKQNSNNVWYYTNIFISK